MAEYDVIIVGAGPAGLSAGLYAVRAGMKTIALEQASCGGQMLLTEIVENYPGFPQGIKGQLLAEQFKAQAVGAGLQIVNQGVKEIIPLDLGTGYTVKTDEASYGTNSIILACGANPRRLAIPGEERLIGRGVSYCATCDGPLFRGRQIIVVGAGNAACEEALFLSKFARRVTLVHRRSRLRADRVFQERLKAEPKIDFIWNSRVVEIAGEAKVSAVTLEDVKTARKKNVSCDGVFIFVGLKPNTDFIKGLLDMDSQGFILTDENLQSSRKGIFACGDCRLRPLRQVVTACGEGAEAAVASYNYVEELKGTAYGKDETFAS